MHGQQGKETTGEGMTVKGMQWAMGELGSQDDRGRGTHELRNAGMGDDEGEGTQGGDNGEEEAQEREQLG